MARTTSRSPLWNLDGSTGGLGTVALTNYGSYSSSLPVAQNDSPHYSRAKYALPTPPGTAVSLSVPDAAASGETFTAKATARVPARSPKVTQLTAALKLPDGWTAGHPSPATVSGLRPGESVTFAWTEHTPSGALAPASPITVVAAYRQQGHAATNRDERIVGYVPPPPPSGSDPVSDLPFLSASNGWGPVERDLSVGGQAVGDGKPITIAGAVYPKGLGTNSVSDVQVFLGGRCSLFTASVGVDDETGGSGTVTFSVIADDETLVTTPTIKGRAAAVPIDVDVTGAQVVGLVVGDAGDGNANDHGDWGRPTLTCA